MIFLTMSANVVFLSLFVLVLGKVLVSRIPEMDRFSTVCSLVFLMFSLTLLDYYFHFILMSLNKQRFRVAKPQADSKPLSKEAAESRLQSATILVGLARDLKVGVEIFKKPFVRVLR